MKQVYREDTFSIYEYRPTLFRPFYIKLEPLTFRRRIRFILAYFSGFKVYYLKEDDVIVGYCIVQSGKDRRYSFATQDDIIVGPYFIDEKYRGRKLSIFLLNFVLKKSGIKFKNAYDYIHKDNIPSIKASKAVGFTYYSDAKVSRYLRSITLYPQNKGDFVILRYQNY